MKAAILLAVFALSLRVSAAVPDSIANLAFALDADDLAGLADGANITSWVDPYNGANSATPPGTAPKKQTFQGHPVCRFIGSDRLTSNSFLDSGFNTAFTAVVVYKSLAIEGDPAPSVAISNQGTAWLIGSQVSGGIKYNTFWSTPTSGAWWPGHAQIVSLRYNGSTHVYWSNKKLINSTAATGNLGLSGALSIGATSTGTLNINGYLRQVYIYERALTDGEIESLVDFLAAKNANFAAVGTDTFLFVGDSQTGNSGGTTNYPALLRPLVDGGGLTYNYYQTSASEGRTLAGMLAAAPAEADPYVETPNTSDMNVVVIWGGTNDAVDQDGPTIVSRLQALCAHFQAFGCKIVIVTCLHSVGESGATTTAKNYYNTWMRANYLTVGDKIADIEADPRLTDPVDNPYYGDATHLSDSGKSVVAELLYPQIVQLYGVGISGISGRAGLAGSASIR